MKKFEERFTSVDALPTPNPDFGHLLKVLKREKPDRYTLFEFFMNADLHNLLSGSVPKPGDREGALVNTARAFWRAGYDYVTFHASDFSFPTNNPEQTKSSISVNAGAIIKDEESYEKYRWPDPDEAYDGRIERMGNILPEGMKIVVCGPGGVLENAMGLMGYEDLCYLMVDEPELTEEVFGQIGQRIFRYYQRIIDLDCVGAIIVNDDWGFNTQTMLAPKDMRKLIFPWHKKIVALAHASGKPAVLHSCGNLDAVYDDLIDAIGFDGKHSYEDKIQPVEAAYDQYSERIAIMGGLDIDFVARREPQEVYERACNILKKTGGKAYGLGSGNSIAPYVPAENYFAMISAAVQNR